MWNTSKIGKFKNCLLDLVKLVLKSRLINCKLCKFTGNYNDWILHQPNKFRIFGMFSIIHAAMAIINFYVNLIMYCDVLTHLSGFFASRSQIWVGLQSFVTL